MKHPAFIKLMESAREPHAMEQTAAYLETQLRQFLKKGERVLICFPKHTRYSLGALMEQAVLRAGGIPLFWGPDHRWISLLRQAFGERPSVVIGPPLVILSLSKLARVAGTPLAVRNVVLAGYPGEEWMREGIRRGLDCRIWGCYAPSTEALVCGFTCGHGLGIHLRDDVYTVRIEDAAGDPVPDGQPGEAVLGLKDSPVWCPTLEQAKLVTSECACGSKTPRVFFLGPGRNADSTLFGLGIQLHSWTSILDCRLQKGEYGLEMEIVTFPGEKLPKLPTCAKQVIRAWDPEKDEPFFIMPPWEADNFPGKNH